MWNKELPVVTAALRLTSRRHTGHSINIFTTAKISYRRVKFDTSVPKLALHREREIIKFRPWCQVGRRACSCRSGARWLCASYNRVKKIRWGRAQMWRTYEACWSLICLPALVHVDLLLYQLSVGTLSLLLRHSDQLNQLRPEETTRCLCAGRIRSLTAGFGQDPAAHLWLMISIYSKLCCWISRSLNAFSSTFHAAIESVEEVFRYIFFQLLGFTNGEKNLELNDFFLYCLT